jgi:hypothetical protein
MVKIVEMDEYITLKEQFEEDVVPVVLLNKFTVKTWGCGSILEGLCRYNNSI